MKKHFNFAEGIVVVGRFVFYVPVIMGRKKKRNETIATAAGCKKKTKR